jgi:ABC-2 type transport system ATP-binding protein
MIAIEARDLQKSYGAVRALDRVTFKIEKGQVIGLLGPNGAGKTTLMKVLTGFLEPDAGEARIGGIDVIADPIGAQRRIGYLPENAPLYGEMLVQDYLQMMVELRGIAPERRRAMLSEAIHATGLAATLTQPIGRLSKGFRQRVGIAQAIVHRPEILILDEPTSGLDPTQIAEIRDLIRVLARDTTVLLSTHILTEVEATCERVLVIMHGQLCADQALADLRASNAALVAIEAGAAGVREALAAIAGVDRVETRGAADGFERWRVVSSDAGDLCPAVFDAVKGKGWRVAELRSDAKTLETVFAELAQRPALEGSMVSGGAASAATEVRP